MTECSAALEGQPNFFKALVSLVVCGGMAHVVCRHALLAY